MALAMTMPYTHAKLELTFTKPRMLCTGFLRCKPTVLSSGRWLLPTYDQLNNKYGYAISDDKGKSFTKYYGSEKIQTQFDETMAYEKEDGSIRMFARTGSAGEIAESTSYDKGLTWSNTTLTGITSPNTRFYIARTPSGRIILVNNDDNKTRKNMTVYLSEDDGLTWKYKKCIDTRNATSYPDVDFYNDKIYLIYDRERMEAKEILLAIFSEYDIIAPSAAIEVKIISNIYKILYALPSQNHHSQNGPSCPSDDVANSKLFLSLRGKKHQSLIPSFPIFW